MSLLSTSHNHFFCSRRRSLLNEPRSSIYGQSRLQILSGFLSVFALPKTPTESWFASTWTTLRLKPSYVCYSLIKIPNVQFQALLIKVAVPSNTACEATQTELVGTKSGSGSAPRLLSAEASGQPANALI